MCFQTHFLACETYESARSGRMKNMQTDQKRVDFSAYAHLNSLPIFPQLFFNGIFRCSVE